MRDTASIGAIKSAAPIDKRIKSNGKISAITKASGLLINYTYDAGGNRISKKVIGGTDTTQQPYRYFKTGKKS